MILTTHALVGAAIAKHAQSPLLLTAILIPLHYFLDVFRHGEYLGKKATFANTTWKVALDLLIGGMTILGASYFSHFDMQTFRIVVFGAFVSMFPDLLTVLYWKMHWKFLGKIYRFHQFVHRRFPDGSKERQWTLRNASNDILFSIIAIFLLFI